MTKPIVDIKGLKTYFNTPEGVARAVDGVSFSIKAGQTFALVGESGCGKSLTALSIIGLVPTPAGFNAGGEILLNNTDFLRLSELEKRRLRGSTVSMIFQEPMTSLNPVFTIGEQISETIRLHQRKTRAEAKKTAIEMLKKVGLTNPAGIYKDYPHSLSGGMRQRVMIAIALSCKPDLLIADEPTTALDVTIQSQILALISNLQKDLNTAVLMITHNMALVYTNAQDVAVMYAGKIVEKGPTPVIFRDPKHPYTIQLLRAIPNRGLRGSPLESIKGSVPQASQYPNGCRFAGRCAREMAGCVGQEPRLREVAQAHLVACLLYEPDFMAGPESTPVSSANMRRSTYSRPQTDKTELINVKGLKKYYTANTGLLNRTKSVNRAVDGIDLTIKRGTTLALVGESGCGKTTAGKSIIQLLRPNAGEVIFDGVDLCKLNERELRKYRSRIQIIFQDPYSSLNPRMTVADIIEEGIRSLLPELGRDERKKRIIDTLDRVGLSSKIMDRFPHEFSGGQRQRIGVARVLAVEPEFIVCDEAVSALDVSVQASILNLLKSIQKDFNITYLFITHDLGVVEYIADEVAVMFGGKIVERGTVEEIFDNPSDPYTKKLLNAIAKITF